jgi:hypothetical protein
LIEKRTGVFDDADEVTEELRRGAGPSSTGATQP